MDLCLADDQSPVTFSELAVQYQSELGGNCCGSFVCFVVQCIGGVLVATWKRVQS